MSVRRSTMAWKGDLRSAWPLTHPDLRREMAQAWVTANAKHPLLQGRDLSTLASALAEPEPREALWSSFADTQLREFREAWSNIDLDSWGWGTDPRPISPGRELALLFDVGGRYGIQEETTLRPGLGVAVELTDDGWLVVELGTEYDDPWAPPTTE
jgi:hypothetical protein